MKISIFQEEAISKTGNWDLMCSPEGIVVRPGWQGISGGGSDSNIVIAISQGIVSRTEELRRWELLVGLIREIRRIYKGDTIQIEGPTVDKKLLLDRSQVISAQSGVSELRADIFGVLVESTGNGEITVSGSVSNTGSQSWMTCLSPEDPYLVGMLVFSEKGDLLVESRSYFPANTLLSGACTSFFFCFPEEKLLEGKCTIIVNVLQEHCFWFQDRGSQPFVGYWTGRPAKRRIVPGLMMGTAVAG